MVLSLYMTTTINLYQLICVLRNTPVQEEQLQLHQNRQGGDRCYSQGVKRPRLEPTRASEVDIHVLDSDDEENICSSSIGILPTTMNELQLPQMRPPSVLSVQRSDSQSQAQVSQPGDTNAVEEEGKEPPSKGGGTGSGPSCSSPSSSSSSSSSGSSDESETEVTEDGLLAAPRHFQGRHSAARKAAIQKVVPFLKSVLDDNFLSDRQKVRVALERAEEVGICFWGRVEGSVYKSKYTAENAVLQLYFQDVLAEHEQEAHAHAQAPA